MYDGGCFGGYTRWAVVFLIIFVLFFLLSSWWLRKDLYNNTCLLMDDIGSRKNPSCKWGIFRLNKPTQSFGG